jgi:hypothetical protein
MKNPDYFNDIAYALEKVLYYERGRGASFRATMIGVDFIKDKKIEADNDEEIMDACIKALVEGEILEGASFQKDETGNLFTFELKSCTHLPVEAKLTEEGVPPYICPPINMILYKIGQQTNLAVEIAKITVIENEGRCVVKVVAFEKGQTPEKS